ncbi:hypothetical protein T07_11301 [Trichinella nelsoni]|uniref:Uncharacterized protein n=1 Tax=Trichinella nelsoni TaxID=6336 RepID=A0A0V0SK56_9BILA|nr:hypothetical protein T07_11301 [Trichinella nelsoni]
MSIQIGPGCSVVNNRSVVLRLSKRLLKEEVEVVCSLKLRIQPCRNQKFQAKTAPEWDRIISRIGTVCLRNCSSTLLRTAIHISLEALPLRSAYLRN